MKLQKLVFMRDNYGECQKNAMVASQTIRDHFSWRHAANEPLIRCSLWAFFSGKIFLVIRLPIGFSRWLHLNKRIL